MLSRASRLTLVVIVCAFIIAGLSCGSAPNAPEYDNPIIPDDPNYEPPQTTIITGPIQNAVLDTHAVAFTWRGNQANMTFAWWIDGRDDLNGNRLWDAGEGSGWTLDTAVTLQYLNEGDYYFEVRGRYASGVIEDTAASRSFTIDDIHGPALWLTPRYQEVASGDSFMVMIMLEEVTNVFAVKVVLEFDPAALQVSNVEIYEDSRSLLKANGGSVIPFSSYDNGTGIAIIEVAIATGDPPGASGTGSLGIITFSSGSAGDYSITITPSSQLRNPDNGSITITEKVGAFVEVAQ